MVIYGSCYAAIQPSSRWDVLFQGVGWLVVELRGVLCAYLVGPATQASWYLRGVLSFKPRCMCGVAILQPCSLQFAVDGVVLADQRDKWWWEAAVSTVSTVVVV